MNNTYTLEDIKAMEATTAIFMLFGGSHCGVCDSLKPKLQTMLAEQFPKLTFLYINCEQSPEICAQYGVFSVPAVKAYIEGMKIIEEAGSFSLGLLAQSIEKPYQFWQSSESYTHQFKDE